MRSPYSCIMATILGGFFLLYLGNKCACFIVQFRVGVVYVENEQVPVWSCQAKRKGNATGIGIKGKVAFE